MPLTLKEARDYSYANILYKQIRCGYSHCHRPNELADHFPMTRRNVGISYTNWLDEKNAQQYIEYIFIINGQKT